jgi:hypothetical protein
LFSGFGQILKTASWQKKSGGIAPVWRTKLRGKVVGKKRRKRVGWLQVSFRKTIKPSFGIKAWNITREVEAWEE